MFRAAKDALAGKSARAYLNEAIARYGKLEDLRIDSKARTLVATGRLHGEKESLTVSVGRYTIETKDGRKFLRLEQCSCDREWVGNLLADYGEGKSFPIPGWAAAALS